MAQKDMAAVRIATMTDYTDPSHQAIPDRVNFIVMDDQGQERPLSIDELTALRSIAFAPHFQEGHQQVGDSIQSLPLATDMYCFLIPQNGSGVAILPQPYKDTVGNSNSGAYEEASRTIISELIINDILQKRSESDTGLYLEDAISVLPISTGRREIDGLLNWVLTQENVQDAIRRAEDKTGRLGNLLGRAGLATVFTTDYIKRLIAKSLMPSLRHASLQDLRRLALKMAMRAERTFQPDHFEDDLITTIEPDSEIFDFDPDRPATMRKSGQKDTVPGPGYIGSGREFVHQPGTYQEYDDGTLNLLDEFGYNPRTNSVFALKGWTVNPDGQAVVAQGFELDDDNNPVLVRGYVWNPETRTAALFV